MLDRFPYPALERFITEVQLSPWCHTALRREFYPFLLVSRSYFQTFAPYCWQKVELNPDTISAIYHALTIHPLLPYASYIRDLQIGDGCFQEPSLLHQLLAILNKLDITFLRELRLDSWYTSRCPIAELINFASNHKEISKAIVNRQSDVLLLHLPNVQYLELREACIPLALIKSVTHLKMTHTAMWDIPEPCDCQDTDFNPLPNLKVLDLTFANRDQGLAALGRIGKGVRELRVVADCPALVVEAITTNFASVKSMKLEPGPYYSMAPSTVDSNHCEEIGRQCPSLEKMDCKCIIFTMAGIMGVLECRNLKNLRCAVFIDPLERHCSRSQIAVLALESMIVEGPVHRDSRRANVVHIQLDLEGIRRLRGQ
ncbi:hypothetical protein HDV00_008841 [Rhizophlyctis rosea]|nr:hypothetical protein HDV00_008841 [Rhizophlyctis rosea]